MFSSNLWVHIISLVIYIVFMQSAFADITVVQNNAPNADIMIAPDASSQVTSAAGILAEYIEKSTEAELSILTSGGTHPVKIHVGSSTYVDGLSLNLNTLTEDGFVIAFPDSSNIVITGRTDWGTEFGVYEFLERYVGVRWLIPGDWGEHVPESDSLLIPVAEVRQDPVFLSRQLIGLQSTAQENWARRNRMHLTIKFHHFLTYIFPVSKYGPNGTDPHPEFYPMDDGERYIPSDDNDYNWQPSFTAANIVSETVNYINNYITTYNSTSFSLGINDSTRFSEDEWVSGVNYLGYKDYSDVYYAWANAVVTGVLTTHPDVKAGCLAYINVSAPPSFSIHPKLAPFICTDRMKWCDSNIESVEKSIHEQWEAKATSLGWYDYIHGAAYLLPRVYPHHMADCYSYGMNHKVRYYNVETYPYWGEGPKLYISLKLQWNPNLDVDDLLDEWYSLTVGGDPDTPGTAAYNLKQYYSHWEDFWTNRVISSSWFSDSSDNVYLGFLGKTYLDIVARTEIEQSRTWLEAVVANAGTAEQQARAELLLKAFEYYETSAISYFTHRDSVGTVEDALGRIDDIDTYVYKRDWLLDVFSSDSALKASFPTRIKKCPLFQDDILSWAESYPEVRQRIQDIASRSQWQRVREDAAGMLDIIDGKYEPTTVLKPSFESSGSWYTWASDGATVARTTAEAHSGTYSYMITSGGSSSIGTIFQVINDIEPGRYALSCWVKAEGTLGLGYVDPTIYLLDSEDNIISGSSSPFEYQYILHAGGGWTHIWYIRDVPSGFNGEEVHGLRILPVRCFAFDTGAEIYIDDVCLYKLTGQSVLTHNGLCLYLPLGEGDGAEAKDFSNFDNDAELHNMDTGSCWVNGKVGDGLEFDGSNDYVDCGNDSSLDITGDITVEAWLKPAAAQVDHATPLSKNGKYKIRLYNNTVYCGSNAGIGYGTAFSYTDDEWIHVAWTFSPTTGDIITYKNGVQQTPVHCGGSIESTTGSLFLGNEYNTTRYYKGIIDEVRVYSRVLSEDEIISHYKESIIVGKWNFEDFAVLDYSGNGNDGTLYNMDTGTCWVDGKIGDGLEFDGVNDQVSCGNDSSLDITGDITVEAWLKPAAAQVDHATPLSKNGKYKIRLYNNMVYCGSNVGIGYGTVFSYTDDEWIHVAWTFSPTTGDIITYKNGVQQTPVHCGGSIESTTGSLLLGNEYNTARCYKGIIDGVRIYNRALSEDEIISDYREGTVAGKWNFEDFTALDYSGNCNDGTLHNMDTGTCWVDGKVGDGLEFDGVNDYVDCGNDNSLDITGDITVEAWLKPAASQVDHATPLSKNQKYKIRLYNNMVYCGSNAGIGYGTAFSYTDDEWIHVAWTFSPTTGDIITYKNGVQQTPVHCGGSIESTTGSLLLGNEYNTARYYKGIIDGVRIYSRVLSPGEISERYNDQ